MGRKSKNNPWRSFHVPLSESVTRDEYIRFDKAYKRWNQEFSKLMSDAAFIKCAMSNVREYRTNFVSSISAEYGKPYLSWDINNSAKYYRVMMTQVRETLLSLADKIVIAQECKQHGWNNSREEIKAVQDACLKLIGYRPKFRLIANLNQAKSIPSMPSIPVFEVDYSSEDNQICRQSFASQDNISYELKIDNGARVNVLIDVPANIREHKTHYARPNIVPVFDDDGDIVDYSVMISYEPETKPPTGDSVLGIDLGKKKAFSAVVKRSDGSVSREFIPTKETENLNEKLNNLYDEVSATKTAIESCCDEDKRVVLEEELARQRKKLSHIRLELARLIGRDVACCAMSNGCSVVQLEDLARLIATGAQITGRWNFAEVRKWVVDTCQLVGVKVVLVSPAFTSKTDPFTNEEVSPRTDRLVVTSAGVMDRDALGAVNVARCDGKRSCRSCDVLDASLAGELLRLPAERVILKSRKSSFKGN